MRELLECLLGISPAGAIIIIIIIIKLLLSTLFPPSFHNPYKKDWFVHSEP